MIDYAARSLIYGASVFGDKKAGVVEGNGSTA